MIRSQVPICRVNTVFPKGTFYHGSGHKSNFYQYLGILLKIWVCFEYDVYNMVLMGRTKHDFKKIT